MTDAAENLDDDGITLNYDSAQEAPEEEVEAPDAESAGSAELPEGEEQGETDEEGNRPKVKFTTEQQEIFNQEIAKKVAKTKQAEQRAQELERRLREIEAKVPQDTRPEIPPMPNIYDPEYEGKVRQRDELIRRQIAWDERERQVTEQLVYQQQQLERQQVAAIQQKVETYSQRAATSGIKQETLQQAGAFVGTIIQHPEIVNHILEDDAGPNITMYLGKNPLEAEKIAQMNPTRAAIYIETQIKPRAATRKTSAPPPPTHLRGRGAAEEQDGPPGARYE